MKSISLRTWDIVCLTQWLAIVGLHVCVLMCVRGCVHVCVALSSCDVFPGGYKSQLSDRYSTV